MLTNAEIAYFIAKSASLDYADGIAEMIGDDVREDVRCSAGERPNDSDIRYAIGRILTERLICTK